MARVTLTVRAPRDADADGMPDYWESRHGLTDPQGDPDADGVSNLAEYLANTDPNDRASVFGVDTIEGKGRQAVLQWTGIGAVRYRIQIGVGAADGSFDNVFHDYVRLLAAEMAPGPLGVPTAMSFDDSLLPFPTSGARYYRLRTVP